MSLLKKLLACSALVLASSAAMAQSPAYDLLLRGGHVIDDRNHIDAVVAGDNFNTQIRMLLAELRH